MLREFRLKMVGSMVAVVVALAGCGGGGGGGASDVNQLANPLVKYEGAYYVCDGHSKRSVTAVAQGGDSLTLTLEEKIYKEENCLGVVVGTLTNPNPMTVKYTGKTAATMPAITVLPYSDMVDVVSASISAMTQQLSGSGVSGLCVNYTNGHTCFDTLIVPAQVGSGAIYLTGNYLVQFELTNGLLAPSDILSKDALFNLKSLVSR